MGPHGGAHGWKAEAADFQAFVPLAQAAVVLIKDLEPIAASAAENKQVA